MEGKLIHSVPTTPCPQCHFPGATKPITTLETPTRNIFDWTVCVVILQGQLVIGKTTSPWLRMSVSMRITKGRWLILPWLSLRSFESQKQFWKPWTSWKRRGVISARVLRYFTFYCWALHALFNLIRGLYHATLKNTDDFEDSVLAFWLMGHCLALLVITIDMINHWWW